MASIAVVTTVYNRSRFVAQTIRSVLAQSHADFEYVIADDGSTDDSLERVRDAVGTDPRVRVLAFRHRGPVDTLADAVAATTAPHLGWVDADDRLDPHALAKSLAILDQRPDVGVVYTDQLVIDDADRPLGVGARGDIPFSKDRLLTDFMTFHFRLIRRRDYDAVGGLDRSFATASDYDLCLRLSEITGFHHLREPLYHYRLHGSMVSGRRRLEQIHSSARAITKALDRRGLSATYALRLELDARFTLRPISPSTASPPPAR